MRPRGEDGPLPPHLADKRRMEIYLAEEANPVRMIYMSFADDNGFLGGIFTRSKGLAHAMKETHEKGINPGGEIQSTIVPSFAEKDVPEHAIDRLLSKQEMTELFGSLIRLDGTKA